MITLAEILRRVRAVGIAQTRGALWRNRHGEAIPVTSQNAELVSASCVIGALFYARAVGWINTDERDALIRETHRASIRAWGYNANQANDILRKTFRDFARLNVVLTDHPSSHRES